MSRDLLIYNNKYYVSALIGRVTLQGQHPPTFKINALFISILLIISKEEAKRSITNENGGRYNQT